jgi:protein TonB
MKPFLLLYPLAHLLKTGGIFCLLLSIGFSIPAQTIGSDSVARAQVYTEVEQMPQLPKANSKYSNKEAVTAAIQRACRYPAEALRNRVQGTVLVGFTVNPEGEVRDVRVEQSLHPDLDEATVAAVKMLPKFRPGKQGGQDVAVRYTLPIRWAIR